MTVNVGAESSLGKISNQLQISRSKKKSLVVLVTIVCCREAKNNNMLLNEPLIPQNHV